MAQERRLPLLDVLESCGIEVVPAGNCNEARRMLETQIQVVLTDRALPDGDWRAVLEIVAQDRANVQVVVCSRLGDHTLLIDVLEQGGYDVLVEPYRREEIRRVYEGDIDRVDLIVGLFAETPPKGFGFSDTAFRIFILMASRRLKSDRFFTNDYTPEVYTREGLDWVDANLFGDVVRRHHPGLAPALEGSKNAFAPWRAVGA